MYTFNQHTIHKEMHTVFPARRLRRGLNIRTLFYTDARLLLCVFVFIAPAKVDG